MFWTYDLVTRTWLLLSNLLKFSYALSLVSIRIVRLKWQKTEPWRLLLPKPFFLDRGGGDGGRGEAVHLPERRFPPHVHERHQLRPGLHQWGRLRRQLPRDVSPLHLPQDMLKTYLASYSSCMHDVCTVLSTIDVVCINQSVCWARLNPIWLYSKGPVHVETLFLCELRAATFS